MIRVKYLLIRDLKFDCASVIFNILLNKDFDGMNSHFLYLLKLQTIILSKTSSVYNSFKCVC